MVRIPFVTMRPEIILREYLGDPGRFLYGSALILFIFILCLGVLLVFPGQDWGQAIERGRSEWPAGH